MAGIFKSGVLLKAPENNEIAGANVKHLEQSTTIRSFSHTSEIPATIIASFVEAAINMASGLVSIAKVDNDSLYFEFSTRRGKICSMIIDEESDDINYEFDEELELSNQVWILASVILFNALKETGARELKDAFHSIKLSITKHEKIANDDAFILCDYITCRLNSRTKASLDIDANNLNKVRNITLNSATGELLVCKEDLTPTINGNNGVFEKLAASFDNVSTNISEQKLGKGNYLFEDELTEDEKRDVQKLTGVVERFEYVDAIETIYDARNREHPKNVVFAYGSTGSGKSFFAKVLSSETGLPYYTISGDEDGGANMFKGTWVIEDGNMVYKPSFFVQKCSRPCIFEIAESSSFLASKLTQIYPFIDKDCMSFVNEDNVLVRRHPHCIIVFTCNVYSCLNDVAPSIPGRAATILELPMMDRDNLRKVILRENDNEPIDSDIMENVLDCVERIEDFLKSPQAPHGCESSIRGYAAWADKIQNSRKRGRYDPIYAAKTTILPIIASGINFDKTISQTILDNIICPTFGCFENGGV